MNTYRTWPYDRFYSYAAYVPGSTIVLSVFHHLKFLNLDCGIPIRDLIHRIFSGWFFTLLFPFYSYVAFRNRPLEFALYIRKVPSIKKNEKKRKFFLGVFSENISCNALPIASETST